MNKLLLFTLAILLSASTCNNKKSMDSIKLTIQETGLTASARGIYSVDSKTVWVVNSKGGYARTIDGGSTWKNGLIAGVDTLDFRDVFALDGQTALAMSAGSGASSRIYQTTDGGKSWNLQLQNEHPKAFFDAFAFWDTQNGILISDPIGDKPHLLLTADGGKTWKPIPPDRLPAIQKEEYCFAASGTCIAVRGENDVWLATGGMASRIFHSADRGQTWKVYNTPMISGASAKGIFSVDFADAKNGVIVGGDYSKPEIAEKNVAVTTDGGKTWRLAEQADSVGYQSCVQFLGKQSYLATGTDGTNYSTDGGNTWQQLDKNGYHAIALDPKRQTAWLVGGKGKVAKVVW